MVQHGWIWTPRMVENGAQEPLKNPPKKPFNFKSDFYRFCNHIFIWSTCKNITKTIVFFRFSANSVCAVDA